MNSEIHVGPMSIAGPFHMGKAAEIIVSDIAARLSLQARGNKNTYMRSSWNTYVDERFTVDKESAIAHLSRTVNRLSPLPSARLFSDDRGNINVKEPVTFRDDDPTFASLVIDAMFRLKSKNIIIPGIVQGQAGLYFDIDAVDMNLVFEQLSETRTFPSNLKIFFERTLDPSNKSAYRGKIPVTKIRKNGIQLPSELLKGNSLHFDERFSPEPNGTKEGKMCISPLTALALVPYARFASAEGKVSFLTVGQASSVRYVLMSVLMSSVLDIPPIEQMHLFGKIKGLQPDDQTLMKDTEWGTKVRYVLLDHLSSWDRDIPEDYFFIRENKLYIPSYGNFRNRLNRIADVLLRQDVNSSGFLTAQDMDNLRREGIFNLLMQMDYGAAFQKMKGLIYKRSKDIKQGISPVDSTLIKLALLFFPDILHA